jgi:hypothetical protein
MNLFSTAAENQTLRDDKVGLRIDGNMPLGKLVWLLLLRRLLANVVGRPRGGVGPSAASQGFVDAAGNPSIYAIEPSIEGIENVAFNDLTIGVDTTGLSEANNTCQWTDVPRRRVRWQPGAPPARTCLGQIPAILPHVWL